MIVKSILSTLMLITLMGCGDSNNISEKRVASSITSMLEIKNIQSSIDIPEFMKIERANWDGVAALTDGFFVTDDENLLSFKIEDDRIAAGTVRTHIVLIDADNNANTGYINARWGDIGAEYLIEGNNIYSYGGTGWNWNLFSRIDRTIVGNEIESEFSINLIEHTPIIRAMSGLFDNQWNIINRSNIVSYTLSNNNGGDDGANFTISDDEANIQFILHNERIQTGEVSTEVLLIDADNNPATGYTNVRWRNIGAEYLIEGNNIFSYAGTGWNWNLLSRIDRVVNGDSIEIDFNKNLVNLSPTIRVIAGLINNQWQNIHMYDIQSFDITNTDNNPEPVRGFTITDDATTITFDIQSQNIINNTATGNSIFIDTDNNPATGYNNTRWQAQLGAEYMIDSNTLFVHGGNGWNWTVVGRLIRTTSDDVLTIVVNKADLNNLAQTIRATPYLLDNQWRVIERFSTLSHTNELPVDNGTLTVSHDIRSFTFTINNNFIDDNSNIEIYIDADNNPRTGFRINGMGAEYRVVGNELTRFRMDTQAWVEPITDVRHRINGHIHSIRITRDAQPLYLRRNISVMAILSDADNNPIHTFTPIEYEVRGDDDEITLSLDDPDFYIFTIHNRQITSGELVNNTQSGDLIGVGAFASRGGGIVTGIHLAFDMDLNRFTGNTMNALGADYWVNSYTDRIYFGFDRTLIGGAHNWMDRWTESATGVSTTVENHVIEVRIPRDSFPRGTFGVGVTLNGMFSDGLTGGHLAWTKEYEFTVE